jgi:hypothetical protein
MTFLRSTFALLAFASALLASPALATEAEDFERALEQVTAPAFSAKASKKSGICVCSDGGVHDGRAGNLTYFPDGSTGYFLVRCAVRRFTGAGNQDASTACFPYLPVGR